VAEKILALTSDYATPVNSKLKFANSRFLKKIKDERVRARVVLSARASPAKKGAKQNPCAQARELMRQYGTFYQNRAE